VIAPRARVALCQATNRLRDAGIDQPAREARLLLTLALDRAGAGVPPDDAAVPDRFWALLERRAAREPMARLRGDAGFWTLDLALSPETLIPRADSETVIEAALAAVPDRASVRRVLDLGTGTGALLLAILAEYPGAWGVGVDLSLGACVQAVRNAAANGLAERACFVRGDWGASLAPGFDLILCNPPYIASDELPDLMPEVREHEPRRALDGGADGLAAYRALIPDLGALLTQAGIAVLEHGRGQGDAVAALLAGAGLSVVARRVDLGGVARVVVAQKPVGDAPR
jgi:release factor glutamine methyltransferase